MRLTVGRKLAAMFATLIVLAGLVTWLGLSAAATASRDAQLIHGRNVRGSGVAARMINDARLSRQSAILSTISIGNPAELQRLDGVLRQVDASVERHLAALRSIFGGRDTAEVRRLVEDRLTPDWAAYVAARGQVLAAVRAGRADAAQATVRTESAAAFDKVEDDITDLLDRIEQRANARADEAAQAYSRNRAIALAVAIPGIAAAILAAWLMGRSIAHRLAEARRLAGRVAAGDLTQRATVRGTDEIAMLVANLNDMADSLASISTNVLNGASSLGSASNEILATVSEHTASAAQQSAAISEITATVEEVRATAESAAGNAQEVARLAGESVRASQAGRETVETMLARMDDVRRRVDTIAADMTALAERVQQIDEITVTINDIADQSNLLALNASIEAAKAGEQGKGFAVVAGEIRNLADQSKQANQQVRDILDEIKRATDAAVMATEQGTKAVESGLQLTGEAGAVITQLEQVISAAADAARQIGAAAQQQSIGLNQIAAGMRDIGQVTGQFVSGAEQSQAAVKDLTKIAGELQRVTGTYRVDRS